jgi:hypothetical protein
MSLLLIGKPWGGSSGAMLRGQLIQLWPNTTGLNASTQPSRRDPQGLAVLLQWAAARGMQVHAFGVESAGGNCTTRHL